MNDSRNEIEVEGQFAIVPEWVLSAPFSSTAKVLYGVLQRYGNSSRKRMPGRAELADEWLHCSKSSVSRASKELEDYGAVVVHRDTRPGHGETGRVITVNRYFLRTTDPAAAVVMPARPRPPVAYPLGHPRTSRPPVRHNRKEQLQPPPTPSAPRPARPEEEVPIEVLRAVDSVDALSEDLRAARRAAGLATARWTNRLVRRALRKAFDAGFDPALMAAALRVIALDRATATPGRLAHDGPWWTTAAGGDRPATRPQPIGCRHCDHGLVVDADGTPTGQKCVHCHPAHRQRGATA